MNTSNYTFSFRDTPEDYEDGALIGNRRITYDVSVDDATQWSNVLTHFLSFLEGVYGYSIKDQVKFDPPAFSLSILAEEEE